MRFTLLLLLPCLLLAGCTDDSERAPSEPRENAAAAPETTNHEAEDALADLIADEWQGRLERSPLLASYAGVHRYDDRLADVSAASQARQLEQDRAFLDRLQAIDRAVLPPGQQLDRDLLAFVLENRIKRNEFRAYRIPFTADSGFHTRIVRMHEAMPFESISDFDNYIQRLRAVNRYLDQHMANMRAGLEEGFTMPRVVLDGVIAAIEAQVVDSPEDSPFYAPFDSMPDTIGADQQRRLSETGRETINDVVVPAYRRLHRFFVDTYRPGARTSIDASALPRGEAYYQFLVRYYTTQEVTAEEVHAIGRREVARIRAEMEAVIEQVDFDGDFDAFVEHLRNDPRFYADSPTDLLEKAAWIAKRIDGQLPAFFGKLPRQPYGIRPVPADIAPSYTTGRYWSAPENGRRGGIYMVNTYALDRRPLYSLPALTLHEAVPGHHLQNALASELENLPPFRRHIRAHAFGEGWGLYAEKLGQEMDGIYQDPYDEFGRLSYEMWRAVRLVVDTGIHAMGWSRERAVAMLADNTALSRHNVNTEINRYISWPGQALAYKMGELKIMELRRRAKQRLGADFDLRAFHDAVLAEGALPLSILESRIEAFIDARAGSP